MSSERPNSEPQDEGPEGAVSDSERSGVLGWVQGTAAGARDRATGVADAMTGADVRRQFEDFTDVVTTAVIGVHHDQEVLRQRLTAAEEAAATSRQEREALSQRLTAAEEAVATTRYDQEVLLQRLTAAEEAAIARQERDAPGQRLSSLELRASQPAGWVIVTGAAALMALALSAGAMLLAAGAL